MSRDNACDNNGCWGWTWNYNYDTDLTYISYGNLAVQYWNYWSNRCDYNSDCSAYHCIYSCYWPNCGCNRYDLYSSFNTPTLMVPCHYLCNSCTVKWSASNCQSCYSTAALMKSYTTCTSRFSSTEGTCYADNQCLTSCPTTFYFWLDKSLTNTPTYSLTYNNAALTNSHFCYLCHKFCKTCSNHDDNTCSTCIDTYYKWQQSRSVCSYYCPEGTYITANTAT